MGMVSSAVYRYFASRDELLTVLIIDAYNALGDAVEAGDAAITERADLRGRWLAVCHGVRRWALSAPAEYALIYGSPVPGYVAPSDTVEAATRTPAVMIRIIADGFESGKLTPTGTEDVPDAVKVDLRQLRDAIAPGLPEAMLARATIGWIHLFGAVSFELFGQLNSVIQARDEYFDYQMHRLADVIGVGAE
jgi:AcrR family transcriptional regulator